MIGVEASQEKSNCISCCVDQAGLRLRALDRAQRKAQAMRSRSVSLNPWLESPLCTEISYGQQGKASLSVERIKSQPQNCNWEPVKYLTNFGQWSSCSPASWLRLWSTWSSKWKFCLGTLLRNFASGNRCLGKSELTWKPCDAELHPAVSPRGVPWWRELCSWNSCGFTRSKLICGFAAEDIADGENYQLISDGWNSISEIE